MADAAIGRVPMSEVMRFADWTLGAGQQVGERGYVGYHRRRATWYERTTRAIGQGVLVVIATALAGMALTPRPVAEASPPPETEPVSMQEAEEGLIATLQQPNAVVGYVATVHNDGCVSVIRPMVAVGPDGSTYLTQVGRLDRDDPQSLRVVAFEPVNLKPGDIRYTTVAWSEGANAFVDITSDVEGSGVVGKGTMSHSDLSC